MFDLLLAGDLIKKLSQRKMHILFCHRVCCALCVHCAGIEDIVFSKNVICNCHKGHCHLCKLGAVDMSSLNQSKHSFGTHMQCAYIVHCVDWGSKKQPTNGATFCYLNHFLLLFFFLDWAMRSSRAQFYDVVCVCVMVPDAICTMNALVTHRANALRTAYAHCCSQRAHCTH